MKRYDIVLLLRLIGTLQAHRLPDLQTTGNLSRNRGIKNEQARLHDNIP